MSDITKKVQRLPTPPYYQAGQPQTFTSADAHQGDVLKVADSLGHPASYAQIQAIGGAMAIRFNVEHTMFIANYQTTPDSINSQLSDHYNLTSGLLVTTDNAWTYQINSGTTFTLDKRFPVSDIELTTVSGTFNIFVI